MSAPVVTTAEQDLLRKIRAGSVIRTLSTDTYYWADGPKGVPVTVSRQDSVVIARLVSARLVRLGETFTYRFGLNRIRMAVLVLSHAGRHAATGTTN